MDSERQDSIAEAALGIDLKRLALGSGEGRRLDLPVEGFDLSHGHEALNAAVEGGAVRLDVSRPTSGWAFRLRFTALVAGRCVRCLEDAERRFEIEAREIDQPAEDDDEMTSPYVEDLVLDVGRWARDALALSIPQQFLCQSDCAGLCPECGARLADVDPVEHRHEKPKDPRFAVLDQLRRE